MMPIRITKYVSEPNSGVIIINGMKYSWFIMIGIPNNKGSLMKKKVVGKEILPSVLYCSLFEKNAIKMLKLNIDPTPPEVKHFAKQLDIIFAGVPFW